MNILLLVIKGIVTGMAVMIPGVSAGSMIMSMGLYDDLMLLISGSKKEKKSTLPRMLPYVGGVLGGIFLFAFIFSKLLQTVPLQTACIFIGLILGGIPMLWRSVNKKKLNAGHWLSFAIAVGVIVVMLIASAQANIANSLAPSVLHVILSCVLGFLAAATMIIPGISGSALMLILGYYNEITERLKALATGFGTLNWAMIGENLLVFIPFLIGAVIAIVLVAKAIRALMDRFPNGTFMAMIGLMAASPLAVIVKITNEYGVNYSAIGVVGYLTAAACLVAGFLISWVLSKKEK